MEDPKKLRIDGIIGDQSYAIHKVRRNAFEAYYRDNLDLLVHDEDPEIYLVAMDHYKKVLGKKSKFILFTINFLPETGVDDLMLKIMKAVRKKWIVDWKFCVEQRSEVAGEFYGIHAHIYTEIAGNKPTYQCRREMYNTFKHMVGNKLHVNCVYAKTKDNFVNYVKGIKKSPEKMEKVLVDHEFRTQNGLKSYYEMKPEVTPEEIATPDV